MTSRLPRIRRVIIDADLLILSLETSEYSDALERFLTDEGSMFFFIVQDCLERACQRYNKNTQQVLNVLSERVGIKITAIEDVNKKVLGDAINNLDAIPINEADDEKYWDSMVELAYAQAHQIQELLTHRPNYFSVYDSVGHQIQIQVIQPTNWQLRLLRLFRQWFSSLGFIEYFILGCLIFVSCSTLIYHIFIKPSPSICNSISYDFLSCGDRELSKTQKQQGIDLFREKKYGDALEEFKSDWKETRDPETLIYLNNAFLELDRKQGGEDFNTIAVLVPLSKKGHTDVNDERDLAKEILRGVAQAQTAHHANIFDKDVFSWEPDNKGDFNFLATTNRPQSNKKGIRVIIVDDDNDPDEIEDLTNKLVKIDEIQGFIGHYASDLTVKAVKIYNEHQKVLISSGSTSEDLANSANQYQYFFRTVPSAKYQAQLLFNYIVDEIPEDKTKEVAVCYVKNSAFSRSIYEEFDNLVKNEETVDFVDYKCIGNKEDKYSFAGLEFDEKNVIEQFDKKGADILVLFPDGQTSKSMQNSLDLIKANNGDKYILGSWNLRNKRTVKTLEDKNKNLVEKLVLAVPWEYPSQEERSNNPRSEKNKYASNVGILWNGVVSPVSALSYDATQALISGMDDETQSLENFLRNYNETRVTGKISFDQYGNRKCNPMLLVKAVEGDNGRLKFEKISNSRTNLLESGEECQDENS
ncbi:MAG: ABC transporter substrate-binding protein [Crocosphaera sp.]|nr:ABC transporter substrate-binding protein [Crocosphaera sp.]